MDKVVSTRINIYNGFANSTEYRLVINVLVTQYFCKYAVYHRDDSLQEKSSSCFIPPRYN